jgi:protochlorophyllide reductase
MPLFLLAGIACVFAIATSKRTVIITGANRGVGLAAVKALAATDEWNIIMACRSRGRAEKAKASIPIGRENVDVKELDLANLKSVQKFASEWGSKPLHVLACNAGIQKSTNPVGREMVKGDSVERTAQGFESTIGTNHIGHFYLTQLLLGNLKSTASQSQSSKCRVVFTGSAVHNPQEPGGDVGAKASLGSMDGLAKGFKYPIAMVDDGEFNPDKAYKDSKLVSTVQYNEHVYDSIHSSVV